MNTHAPPTNLGTLVEVDLRAAWTHEALSFTPWLASNLDRLADAIGMPLEHVNSEVAVQGFAADILAVNPEDGSRVLIENQLEKSDHGHLGQVLTYLAGLEAQTTIWIARDFADAHLSAIRWLNQHTVDPFAFFAVKLRAVRIGESQIAPLFDVVERPNDWERRVQKVVRESPGGSELNKFWKEFWAHFLARHPAEGEEAYALSVRWRTVHGVDLFVSQYIAGKEVGVFVRGDRGVDAEITADALAPHAEVLSERLGAPFRFGKRQMFFPKQFAVDTKDRANWDSMSDWLHNEADAYVATLKDVLGG